MAKPRHAYGCHYGRSPDAPMMRTSASPLQRLAMSDRDDNGVLAGNTVSVAEWEWGRAEDLEVHIVTGCALSGAV
jgi:hypothetical protein